MGADKAQGKIKFSLDSNAITKVPTATALYVIRLEYRTVYFKDYDGIEYKIMLSIGKNDGISTVYNVGKIKADMIPAGKIISRRGGQSPMASISADTNIQHSGEKVKDFFLKINIEQSKDVTVQVYL